MNCTEPGDVCFCASMGTGPQVGSEYDLALTECVDERGHSFLVDVGSERGAEVLAALPVRPADAGEVEAGRVAVARAATAMGRAVPAADLPAVRELHAGVPDVFLPDDGGCHRSER